MKTINSNTINAAIALVLAALVTITVMSWISYHKSEATPQVLSTVVTYDEAMQKDFAWEMSKKYTTTIQLDSPNVLKIADGHMLGMFSSAVSLETSMEYGLKTLVNELPDIYSGAKDKGLTHIKVYDKGTYQYTIHVDTKSAYF